MEAEKRNTQHLLSGRSASDAFLNIDLTPGGASGHTDLNKRPTEIILKIKIMQNKCV